METLEENEKHIKEEQDELLAGNAPKKGKKADDSDDMDDGDDSEDFEKFKSSLRKFANGELDDDEDDSDYEEAGGDLDLYDSKLDEIDELNFMKETMSGLMQN